MQTSRQPVLIVHYFWMSRKIEMAWFTGD